MVIAKASRYLAGGLKQAQRRGRGSAAGYWKLFLLVKIMKELCFPGLYKIERVQPCSCFEDHEHHDASYTSSMPFQYC